MSAAPADRWPRLMRRETAAAYCDMSADQFDRQCPVPAKDQGWRGLRWDRAALDRWIDNLPDRPARGAPALDSGLDSRPQPEAGQGPGLTPQERRRQSLQRA
ncbi:MAG: hypothetical protein NW200_12465 [Hyphomonadaceae bacterium]|nr:hypothetical protein [Hyphomonadaceae bacterium]